MKLLLAVFSQQKMLIINIIANTIWSKPMLAMFSQQSKDADKHTCKHHLVKTDAGNVFTTKYADKLNCKHHLVKTDAGNIPQLLRREIDAALLDRDRTIKEAHELREKLGIQSDVWIFIKL